MKIFSKQRRPPSPPPWSTDYDGLHLCLAGCGDGGPGPRVSYLNFSISKTKLFRSRGRGGAIHVNKPPENEKCLGNLGSKFLFAGDQQLKDDTEGQNIIVYDTDTAGMSGPLQKPHQNISMLSRKASPLVVSVHDTVSSGSSQQPPQYSLYVLAGPPLNTVPDPAFEKLSYDRETSTWANTRLPSPPFLDPSCKYFQDPECCAHVVIKHEIHVSTSSSSFTFDTIAGEWKKCTLFGDARPWTEDIHYPPPYEWMNYPVDNKVADKLITDNIDNKMMDIQPADNKKYSGLQSCGGGAPFNFDGGAVLCRVNDDDLLIGIVLSQGVLVVQKLVNNKVVVVDIDGLRDLEIPIHAISASLADFGQGLLCLVVSCFDHKQSQKNSKSEIFITSFQFWRNNNQKLKCKVREKFFLSSIKQSSPYQIWSAISCFVPKNSMHTTPTTTVPIDNVSKEAQRSHLTKLVRAAVDPARYFVNCGYA
ncbi:hypothetical protein CsSME_00029928 [Camellia sinensis var. sinensis]